MAALLFCGTTKSWANDGKYTALEPLKLDVPEMKVEMPSLEQSPRLTIAQEPSYRLGTVARQRRVVVWHHGQLRQWHQIHGEGNAPRRFHRQFMAFWPHGNSLRRCHDSPQGIRSDALAVADLLSNLYGEDYSDPEFQRLVDGQGTPGSPDYSAPLVDEGSYFSIKSDHLTEFSADLGMYFNIPLSERFALGSKLLVGRSIMQEIDLNAFFTGGMRRLEFVPTPDGEDYDIKVTCLPENYTAEWDYFTVGGNNTMKFGTGLSLTYAYKENYAWKVFLDYDFSRKTYTMTYNPSDFLVKSVGWTPEELEDEYFDTQSIKKNRHTFILGGSFTISF